MKNIHWLNTVFLFGTFLTTLIGVPAYLWHFGFDPFQLVLFLFFFIATGLSITLGYHRLFSHLTFQAATPVRLFTLLFGAAAFEDSALRWCADHRRHHKHVDHDDDPYDINKGFWHAHIGWLLFRRGPDTPLTWVRDLQKDRLACWQHRYYLALALGVGFVLPTLIGFLWGGWVSALGAFLIAGVARVVFVHHMTFCINSLCHWTGKRPYSTKCSARDSFLMALFTFGEGYHNYHHEFQHDYRNGVKPWQWDPTKWTIRILQATGLVRNLRTVPRAKILQAEVTEQRRQLAAKLESHPAAGGAFSGMLDSAHAAFDHALEKWMNLHTEWQKLRDRQVEASRAYRANLQRQLRETGRQLTETFRQWKHACSMIESACA